MDHALHGSAKRDVGTESGSATTAFAYGFGDSPSLIFMLAIVYGERSPRLGQCQDNRFADAVRAASDQSHAALQLRHAEFLYPQRLVERLWKQRDEESRAGQPLPAQGAQAGAPTAEGPQ